MWKNISEWTSYDLFAGCGECHYVARHILDNGHAYPDINSDTGSLDGAYNYFCFAPTTHWNSVLKVYNTDKYLISTHQTKHLNFRNYHKGFTTLIVANDTIMFDIEATGNGTRINSQLKLWDEKYAASDLRSVYIGKGYRENKRESSRFFSLLERLVECKQQMLEIFFYH